MHCADRWCMCGQCGCPACKVMIRDIPLLLCHQGVFPLFRVCVDLYRQLPHRGGSRGQECCMQRLGTCVRVPVAAALTTGPRWSVRIAQQFGSCVHSCVPCSCAACAACTHWLHCLAMYAVVVPGPGVGHSSSRCRCAEKAAGVDTPSLCRADVLMLPGSQTGPHSRTSCIPPHGCRVLPVCLALVPVV